MTLERLERVLPPPQHFADAWLQMLARVLFCATANLQDIDPSYTGFRPSCAALQSPPLPVSPQVTTDPFFS